MLLLDKLHESLNLVKKKPYTENPEGNGTNDEAVAAEAWRLLLLRESSFVQSLLGGLVRSEVTCQKCKHTSVRFDYQVTHQIAIPQSTERQIHICFIPAIAANNNNFIKATKGAAILLSTVTVDKQSSMRVLFNKMSALRLTQFSEEDNDSDDEAESPKLLYFEAITEGQQGWRLIRFLDEKDSLIKSNRSNYD